MNIAQRASRKGPWTKPRTIRVEDDPALMAIARMVVAGIDKRYRLHPCYRKSVKSSGCKEARELIEGAVAIPGACDVIQTDMGYGGIGLYGGLAENSARFKFYEWVSGDEIGRLTVSFTRQEARDIVSGKKKTIRFRPERFSIRLVIDPRASRAPSAPVSLAVLLRKRPRRYKPVWAKDVAAWAMPRKDVDETL